MAADMKVPRFFTQVARHIVRHPRFWQRMGGLEAAVLKPDLEDWPVKQPLYVCGLARAGSTLLLELLAAHPKAASHRYEDFPFIFTPYWWRLVLRLSPFKDKALRERAHGDGMLVNAASPEAMEEMLWMSFFDGLHDDSRNNVLGRGVDNPAFERFYEKHIRKLLLSGKAPRYVSKGNYNFTRMAYLLKLFPDARFVVPVRLPSGHVASLMRQHERFVKAGKEDADVAEHMALAGHFEFGLKRTPIHTGDDARMAEIKAAWQGGEELRGWALYWDMLHAHLLAQLAQDEALRRACLIVRFEELCEKPLEVLRGVYAHCGLEVDEATLEKQAARVKAPDYYEARFSTDEQETIRAITADTARALGY